MSVLTYNVKLIFDKESDKLSLIDMLEAQRFVFNEASKINFGLKKNSVVLLHNQFYHKFRENQPSIPSQIIIRAENESLSCYRSAKSNKHKLTKPIFKKNLSMRLDKRCFSHKENVFSIISLGKRVKCRPLLYPKLQEFLGKYRFCDPLIFKRNSDIFLSLTFEIPQMLVQDKVATGVDFGIRVFAATSDGILFKDNVFKRRKRQLRFLKRKLQSCGSKSARKHLRRIKRKEHNRNKNFNHHLANAILSSAKGNVIALEDLKGIKKKKNKLQNKNNISQVSFAELRRILIYKAPFYKKEVKTVPAHYSSQTDCETGLIKGKRVGRRFYSENGRVYDAEINAAINLAKRTNHPISIGSYLDGQGKVSCPIVRRSFPSENLVKQNRPPILIGVTDWRRY